MRKLIQITTLATLLPASACTQNQRARSFGGTATQSLAPGQKLVLVTWKDEDMWILTRPKRDGETPETYEFKEYSSFGIIEGKVIIQER